MFGWLPIIGPIIDGIVSIWKGYQQVDVAKYTVDGKVQVEAMQASANIIESTKDDIGIRIARDILIFPTCIWMALISWDTIMAIKYPFVMWHVEKYPDSVSYFPLAVITFLLGNQALNIWKRK